MSTRTSTRPQLQKLDFAEKLTQQGKGAGTDALLKRLKTLHQKLAQLDQDNVDTKSLDAVNKQLISSVILHHKDRGVKAYAACCLADLLRLYAPDAPYTADDLRDIFQFFIVQVTTNLKAPTAKPLAPSKRGNEASQGASRITDVPYHAEYCYLIDSLATIKSIVLICDLPGADDLITTYFESILEVVRPDMNKSLSRNLASLLVEVLNEADSVPSGVMDVIFSQFQEFTSPNKPESTQFMFIKEVCNRSVVKLQRPVYAHFSEIQLSHGRDPSPADMKELEESHSLLLSIYRHCPDLLLNVIPLLEENLRAADEVPLRQLSTKTLGTMFSERPVLQLGVVDLARAYPSAWRSWCGRRVDKTLGVRLAWVEATGRILANQPNLRNQVEADLMDRIQDSDERVRAAICKVVGSLDYEVTMHSISLPLLHAVGHRISDKKSAVREEAINALARLWSLAFSAIEENDEEAVAHFGWIPREMLNATRRTDGTVELRSQVNSAFKNTILPLPAKPDDEQAWVDRFLLVASSLDEGSFIALDMFTGLKGYASGHSPYRAFVQFCEDYNGGETTKKEAKERLDWVIEAMVRMLFADPHKAKKDLNAFATANEPRLYKLLNALFDPQSDLRTIIKSKNEFLRRIEQSHTSLLDTFTTLVDSGAWILINHSSIPSLIKRLQKPEGPRAERVAQVAARYLSFIAKECAPMYKTHVQELSIIINDKHNNKLVETGLQALAAVSKWDVESGPSDKKVVERAMQLAISGTPRQAKFAARFIAYSKDGGAAKKLITSIWKEMQKGDETTLLPLLHATAELALSAPAAFETKSEEIIGYIMGEIMLRPSPSGENQDDVWVEEDDLETLDRAKLAAMRVCTHRSLGWARESNAVELVQPTFKLLYQILVNEGRVSDDTQEGGPARCHMRLRATLCMLKLANVRAFDKAMSPYFEQIAYGMQDPNFSVRQRILKKLSEVLPAQRIMPKWNILPILSALDPEQENILTARMIMAKAIKTASARSMEERIDRVEMPLARLLYVLCRHPDLGWEVESELQDVARFIELFIDCVAHRDNVPLLYTIANKLKTVCVAGEDMDEEKLRLIMEQDAGETIESPTLNLYKLSELTQSILRNRAHQMSWPLSTNAMKVRLPSDIFSNLPSTSVARMIPAKQFLPESITEWVKGFGKKSANHHRRVTDRSSPKKRTRSGPKAPRKKRRSSKADKDEEEQEDEESEDDEASDSDDEDEEDGDESSSVEGNAEAEEDADGDAVMGRGGRRNAKTKARKAVTRKSNKGKREKQTRNVVEDSDSEALTELED